MFKRIRNLLDISKYEVRTDLKLNKYGQPTTEHTIVSSGKPRKKPATIVDVDAYIALDEFPNEANK